MSRRRLDEEMVVRGISRDLDVARSAIANRTVLVSGSIALKPETLVSKAEPISVETKRRFVSRGGEKLNGALEDLGLDVSGIRCLDAGAGSGGFTDCLLQNGADEVIAVDVGYGQFDYGLRSDHRVHLWERTHIAKVSAEELKSPFDLVVADLSFTSVANLVGPLSSFLTDDGNLLLLVKPQFEAARSEVPHGGVVSNPQVWLDCLESVSASMLRNGISVAGACASRVRGAEGNQEFFVLGRRGTDSHLDILREAVRSIT